MGSAAQLRLANAAAGEPEPILSRNEKFEVCSLIGTLEYNETTDKASCHLHISLADGDGNMIGGHVMPGCKINVTLEVVLLELENWRFRREFDPRTGYKELV